MKTQIFDCTSYQTTTDSLAGKVILVAGASGAIGSEVAKACAASGASVILQGRKTRRLEQLYDAIENAGRPEPVLAPFDYHKVDTTAYQELATMIATEFGKLDGLVFAAGIPGHLAPVDQLSFANWQQVMLVNMQAPFLITQACLPLLRKAQAASVVFTSEEKQRAYWASYAMSKAALNAFASVLCDELDGTSAIRVNAVNPAPTRSGLRQAAYPAENPDALNAATDCVNAFLYLLSNDSGKTNGQILSLNKQDA